MNPWYFLLAWLLANVLLLLGYRRELARLWREPVLRHPVLIVESDDWGAGPPAQATALRGLAEILMRHRDAGGRPPVFSLALILAVADTRAMGEQGGYRRLMLDAPPHADILAALKQGVRDGVFALQLHGMEHYWPPTLLASGDERVRAWLRAETPAATEQLPSHLQSRWVNASALPSSPLDGEAIRDAVAEEVSAYTAILGAPPKVAVPPTFVWTREVERAWAERGIEFVVTPGWRYTRRDAEGIPDGDEGPIDNGDREGGMTYLTRCEYFEPSRGRDAAHALRALDKATSQGRPCLLENHRDNFIADAASREHALGEVDKLYREALDRYRSLRFMSTLELGEALRAGDPAWIETRLARRLGAMSQRARAHGRLWKLATLSGLAMLVTMSSWIFPRLNPAAAR